MTSSAERQQQITKIHIIPNISRSEGNQTMTFGQLAVYNINIFLEKSCTSCGGEASPRPRPFSKESTLIISLDQP